VHVLVGTRAGPRRRGRESKKTFETAIAFCNDVGLLAEEVDSSTGELLGNFPQAFSHIGVGQRRVGNHRTARYSRRRRVASPAHPQASDTPILPCP
jgi:hypothetical protein